MHIYFYYNKLLFIIFGRFGLVNLLKYEDIHSTTKITGHPYLND